MPLKYLILLCAFFLVGMLASSQQKILEYKLEADDVEAAHARLRFQDDRIIGTVGYKKGVERFVLQHDSLLMHTYQQKNVDNNNNQKGSILKWDFENPELSHLNSFMSGDTLLECNYAKEEKSLYYTQTLLSERFTYSTDTMVLSAGESLLVSAAGKQALYVVCSVKHTDELIIYVKQIGQPVRKYSKTIPFSNPAEKNKKGYKVLADYFSASSGGYFVFDERQSYPSALSAEKNKIYVQEGQIIFSLENGIYETYVIALQLDNLSSTIDRYPSLPWVKQLTEDPSDFVNSCIRDSFLCKTGVFQDVFFLQLYNIGSKKLVYNTFVPINDKNAFAAAPYFKTASFFTTKDKSPKRIIYLLKNDYFYLLFDRPDSNTCSIALQLYDKKATVGTFLGAVGSLTLFGSVNSAMTFYNWMKDVPGSGIQNTIDCNTGIINGKTVDGRTPLYVRLAGLQAFFKEQAIDTDKPVVYIFNDTIYTCYVDEETQKFYVYRF